MQNPKESIFVTCSVNDFTQQLTDFYGALAQKVFDNEKERGAKLNLKFRLCEETFRNLTVIEEPLKSFSERFLKILGLNSDCFYMTGKMYNMSEI